MPVQNLVLSDDETVALAMLAGRAWPAPLPTVDSDDPDDLIEAGRRGLRSLAVRELVDLPDTAPGTTEPRVPVLRRDVADLCAEIFGTAVQAVGYAATDDLTWLPGGLTAVLHGLGTGDTWTMQIVSHAGLSYFSRVPAVEARDMLSELLHGAVDSGFTAPAVGSGPAPRWYCVSHEAQGQTLVLAAARGEHRLHRWDPERAAFAAIEHPGDLPTAERSLWRGIDRLTSAGTS
jgi:hypothetical protein